MATRTPYKARLTPMNSYNHLGHSQPSRVRLLPVHHGYPATNHVHQGTINLWRLIQEDPGVKGSCWFAKHREDPGHIAANIIRIIVLLIISPIYIMVLDIILLRRWVFFLLRDSQIMVDQLQRTSQRDEEVVVL